MGTVLNLRRAFTLIMVGLTMIFSFEAMAVIAFPSLTGRVVDQANILSSPVKLKIISELEHFEGEDKGPQLVVVTVGSLGGKSIEEYTLELGRLWKIGHAGKDNGIILLIAPNEREVRIEVGYGLEHILTDAVSNQIIRNVLVPELKKNHWDDAAEAGVEAIIKEVNSPQRLPASKISTSKKDESFDWWLVAIVLFVLFFHKIRYLFVSCLNLLIVGVLIFPLNAVFSLFGRKPIAFKGFPLPSRSGKGGRSGGGFWRGGGFGGGGGSFGGGGSSGRF